MPHHRSTLEVDGHVIQLGQSFYHTRTDEVFWYLGLEDGVVLLDGFEGTLELPESTFREKIAIGDLEIEA